MATKKNDRDFLQGYKVADPEERLHLMMSNYAIFPKLIHKAETKTIYKIKSEKEFLRSHSIDELEIRVQTSTRSDSTADEAIANVSLEEAFTTRKVDRGILNGIENASEYEADIYVISVMKMDYDLLRDIIEDLQEDDCRVIKQYLINGRLMKEIAEDENRTYEAIKKRIQHIRSEIHEEIIDCLEMNCGMIGCSQRDDAL